MNKFFTLKLGSMKQLITALALVGVFASCKNDKTQTRDNVTLLQDTFRMYNNSVVTDRAATSAAYTEPSRPAKTTVTPRKTTNRVSNSSSGQGTVAQAPAKKKGWSKRAKGAAIGAGAGAAAGAVINGRNRGAGAVIGGVVGAAGGYIIGNEMDRKDGRN